MPCARSSAKRRTISLPIGSKMQCVHCLVTLLVPVEFTAILRLFLLQFGYNTLASFLAHPFRSFQGIYRHPWLPIAPNGPRARPDPQIHLFPMRSARSRRSFLGVETPQPAMNGPRSCTVSLRRTETRKSSRTHNRF